ncbi:hypothetical protein D9758_002008 [Tetrapyrgos nigripes]|uniref:Alpha/beta hydrolase fold-3 domain-containing protein n=1 Tax=Tetrapyrgos nigripes TaxID=182062 RepID=A0A8H5GTA8_9AGAR|nr:hypothetical protein D9758_002008 [Tetrapyrgos nigripes]
MVLGYRHQPWKGLYLCYDFLGTLFVRVPLWFLFSIPRSWRPRFSWSIKQTLLVQIFRHVVVDVMDQTGPIFPVPDHRVLKDGPAVNGVWIDPVPDDLIVGRLRTWAFVASVSPIRVPGYWYFKNNDHKPMPTDPVSPGEKILYTFHGGSYISESSSPSGISTNIVRGLFQHVDKVTRVFAVEYRLSTTAPLEPANPFPAALIDALTGYYYLVHTCGISPNDVLISGDSAGGNLALALTRYLVDYSHTFQSLYPSLDHRSPSHSIIPGSLLLLSPWCDIGLSHDVPRSTALLVADFDPEPQGMDYAKQAYVGPFGMGAADMNEYISPSSRHPYFSASFKHFPKTLIVAGGAENLLPQIKLLRDRMIRDIGNDGEGDGKVVYYEAEDACHDFLLFAWTEPARSDTWQVIARWLEAES